MEKKTKRETIEAFLESCGPETQLQNKCWYYVRNNRPDLVFHSIPNEGKRTKAENFRLKLIGLYSGCFDSVIFSQHSGELAYFEFKNKGAKLSEEQQKFKSQLEKAKIDFFIIESVESFKKNIDMFFSSKYALSEKI